MVLVCILCTLYTRKQYILFPPNGWVEILTNHKERHVKQTNKYKLHLIKLDDNQVE